MQSVLSRIWTRVTVSISYDDNHYTTGTHYTVPIISDIIDIILIISDKTSISSNIGDVLSIPDIGLAIRVFANGPGDLGSIPGRVIPKTQKMVLDASLLNTQHYKVRIKGKVEQSRERSRALPYILV